MRKIRFFMNLVTFLLVTNLFAQTNHFPTSGNVGIGTLSPSRPLHINMGSSWTARFESTSGYIDIGPANSTGAHIYTDRAQFYFNKDISLVGNPSRIRAYQSNPFYINVGLSDRIAVLSNGNVGIGITNPGALLHINRNVSGQNVIFGKGADGNFKVSYWQDISSNASGAILGEFGLDYNDIRNSAVRFHRGPSTLGGFITFTTNDGTEKVRILANGNFGIGTTVPTHRLEVNGTIRAKEVKLEAAEWPDYVFEAGYKMMPLDEVESYIREYGHLPGFQSAEVYERDGVNIMEMNRKLLEKVEELTMIVIGQEKRIKQLENQLKQ